MVSREAQKIREILRANYQPVTDYKHMNVQNMRDVFNAGITWGPLPEGISYHDEKVGGVTVEKITADSASDKIILHIHGGGMVVGDHHSDRFMLAHLASRTRRNAYSVNYRLSPEFAQPAAIEDCVSVYQGLLDMGYSGKDIALIGESAGGALAMSLCAYLKKNCMEMPAAVCCISGSVDARYESVSMKRNMPTELVVNANLPETMNAIYFKDCDPMDPVLSPIHSDLTGWPPVYLIACREEILLDESIRMYLKLEEAGVETELSVKEGLFHCYMVYDLPESYEAFDEIAAFFNKH